MNAGAGSAAAAATGLALPVVASPAPVRPRDADTRRFRRYVTVFVLTAPPALAYLVYRRPETLTLGQGLLAAAVVLLGCVPSLAFLSVDGIYRALGHEKRDARSPQYTDHCFTGDYPTDLVDQTGRANTGQLSFLSEVR